MVTQTSNWSSVNRQCNSKTKTRRNIVKISENKAVSQLSELLSLHCGYSEKDASQIKVAAALHDIGKMRVSKSILQKPDNLLPSEFEEMKMHTKYGSNYLASIIPGELGKKASMIALFHHEWHDGHGYWGFKASSLPKYIGIVSICDVLCALLSERDYKQSWTLKESLEYIYDAKETQFCPKLVDELLSLLSSNDKATNVLKHVA